MKRVDLVVDPVERGNVREIVTAARAALQWKGLKHRVQDGGRNGGLRQVSSVRDQMAGREPQCNDDVDLGIGFESIECRVQRRYAPIAVEPRLGRDR